jgi:riboflavin kinase/FMN adenylyltransferase
MLTSREFKLHLMARLGFTHALVVNFTPRFASLEAVDFVAELCKAASPLAGICIGEGWHFGRGRLGDAALLRKLGAEYGFFTKEVPHVRSNGDVVSSTLIRQTIANGDMQKASRLLGRPFAIPGIVQRGAGIGHQLGFPTANLATGHEQYPPDGVYAVGVTVDGEHHRGVANIGIRPTVTKSLNRVLEVHLFNFSGDLYGSEIEVAFLHFLRPEIKFENIAALRARIELDVVAAHDWHLQQDKPA